MNVEVKFEMMKYWKSIEHIEILCSKGNVELLNMSKSQNVEILKMLKCKVPGRDPKDPQIHENP